ncbi:hypothetical protein KM1_181270 [Entamoeba histolytica HM-3:IMSS]|uniref:Uncharacterized protein n=1 Tax=Entamoeba histolytica HM-3:IMSS TaxID=885315 RepID=M7W559_ENTHI|nr:hypothetical protein KM1_181270 [Entamoeba histolytica HM-3:IMSS]
MSLKPITPLQYQDEVFAFVEKLEDKIVKIESTINIVSQYEQKLNTENEELQKRIKSQEEKIHQKDKEIQELEHQLEMLTQ